MLRLFEPVEAIFTSLRSYITGVAARNLNTYILGIESAYDALVALKERVAPTDTARQLHLSTQYASQKGLVFLAQLGVDTCTVGTWRLLQETARIG